MATKGIRLGLVPVRGGDLASLKPNMNTWWRFIEPTFQDDMPPDPASSAEAQDGDDKKKKKKKKKNNNDDNDSASDSDNDESDSSDDDETQDNNHNGNSNNRRSPPMSPTGLSSGHLFRKPPAPAIVRHGDQVCLEQGWFRLHQGRVDRQKALIEGGVAGDKHIASAKTELRHVRLGADEMMITPYASVWHIHVRDVARRMKVSENTNCRQRL